MDEAGRQAWVRRMLEGALGEIADEARAEARAAARQAWARGRIAALQAAQRRADEAWMALVAGRPEDGDDGEEIDPPPEQAVVDAIWAEIDDVRRIGRWPRALHWGLI